MFARAKTASSTSLPAKSLHLNDHVKDAGKFLAYFVAIVVVGCSIAPPLWWAGQAIGSALGIELLTDQTFQRYFNRAILVAAVVLLWPLFHWLKIKSFAEFQLTRNPARWRDLGIGFAAAFVILLLMGMISIVFSIYELQEIIRWHKYWKIPATMTAVSLLEEALFRGIILGLVLRSARPVAAAVFTSALFSIVHFLKPKEVDIGEISWLSGFQLLPYSFHQFTEPLLVLGGFTTLFAIGMVLAQSRLATRSLWMPIGLHAGWIAGNRVFNITFKQQDVVWPWFGPRIEIGLAPLVTVIITGILIYLLTRNREPGKTLD